MYGSNRPSLGGWIVGGLSALVAFGLFWFVFGYYADATSRIWKFIAQVFLERWLFPGGLNPLHFTWFFWFLLGILGVIVSLVSRKAAWVALTGIAWVLFLIVVCLNINDHSGSYASGTSFVVEDVDKIPSSLRRLVNDTVPDTNGCALYANNDMRGCINESKFRFEWTARKASATGAEQVIRRSSSGVPNTQILSDSLTYIYDDKGGYWTAIRDGKSRQPIYGIAAWAGEGNVQNCTFSGKYELNKAFDGRWGKNLADEIAGKYPELFFDNTDRYGYCDGDKPVIVIPVKEQQPYHRRTTFRSAGVLVITGSPTGKALYRHVMNVKPGQFPGPVYPASLAKVQRESMGMIAGVWDNLSGRFGYETTDVTTQSGNASEYQLRDRLTNRIYWVTPMKPRKSDEQVLTTYSVTAADAATSGRLNDQRIFVLPDGDARTVNLDDLEARTREAVLNESPGFFSAQGNLVEFLPLSGETWQVYAELRGRVVYRITVPTDSRIRPTVFQLDEPTEPTGGQPQRASACVENLRSLTDKGLAECLSDIAEELSNRQNKNSR